MRFAMHLIPLYFLLRVNGQKDGGQGSQSQEPQKPSLQFFNGPPDDYTFSFITHQNIPEFTNNSNLNIVSHFCTNGTWVWYENQNYEKGGEVISGINVCGNYERKHTQRWNSLRYVGTPDDIQGQALNLYSEVWLRGNETLITEDRSDINIKFNSLMLSGPNNAALFIGTNYTGFSYCISAQESGFHPNNLYTVTWDVDDQLGLAWDQIRSVKFNCECENTKMVEDSQVVESNTGLLID